MVLLGGFKGLPWFEGVFGVLRFPLCFFREL